MCDGSKSSFGIRSRPLISGEYFAPFVSILPASIALGNGQRQCGYIGRQIDFFRIGMKKLSIARTLG
jgi:hypothetical protein